MKIVFPSGTGNISLAGSPEIKVTEGAVVDVPDRFVEDLVRYHGAHIASPAEIGRAEKMAPKPVGTKPSAN